MRCSRLLHLAMKGLYAGFAAGLLLSTLNCVLAQEHWKVAARPLLEGLDASTASLFFNTWPYNTTAGSDAEYEDAFKKCLVRKASEWCFRELNAKYNNQNLWNPQEISGDVHFRKRPDCSYKATPSGVERLTSHNSFLFTIDQFNCSSTIPSEPSGGGCV